MKQARFLALIFALGGHGPGAHQCVWGQIPIVDQHHPPPRNHFFGRALAIGLVAAGAISESAGGQFTPYNRSAGELQTMRPSEALSLHRSQIREIALRHRVSSVRVFGSALRAQVEALSL